MMSRPVLVGVLSWSIKVVKKKKIKGSRTIKMTQITWARSIKSEEKNNGRSNELSAGAQPGKHIPLV